MDAAIYKNVQPFVKKKVRENGDGSFGKSYLERTYVKFGYSLIIYSLLIFLVSVICFENSYCAEFAFDDSEAIINNKDITERKPIADIFFNDFWGGKLASNTSHKSYRPFTILTFRLNYWLVGGLHPAIFHICNIILHGVVSVMLLPFYLVILGRKSEGNDEKQILKLAALCSVMFACHPVHTESVSAVVGRADLLCALCFIISFLLCAHHINAEPVYCIWRWSTLLISMLFVIFSVLFKEQGITVLAICCVYDLFIVNRLHPTQLVQFFLSSRKQFSILSNSSSFLIRQLILFLTGSFILLVRWQLMGSQVPTFQVVDNPHSFVESRILRVINYNYIYSLNAYLLLNPWWLCFDWSMGCVPVIESYFDPRIFIVVLFWILSALVIKAALMGRHSHEQRHLVLSLCLLIIPFLPASNLLFRVGFVIAERNLYLPSIGFVLLIALGVQRLSRYNRQIVTVLTSLLILVNICRSVSRSSDWLNEKKLFSSAVQVCPLNAKVHYNIGKLQADEGSIDEAIENYKLAIQLNDKYDQAMNNLANIYKDRRELTLAQELLSRAVSVRPDFSTGWMNLGIVQADLKQYVEAEKSYITALKHRHHYPNCYYNLGNLYLDQARHAEALEAWRQAVMQKPSHINAWTNSLLLLENLGRQEDLEKVAVEALRHNPEDPAIHFSLAGSLGKSGRFEESERHFLLAIQYRPNYALYHANLGVLYHRWGRSEAAETSYNKALQIDPNHSSTIENLAMLRKSHKNKMTL